MTVKSQTRLLSFKFVTLYHPHITYINTSYYRKFVTLFDVNTFFSEPSRLLLLNTYTM